VKNKQTDNKSYRFVGYTHQAVLTYSNHTKSARHFLACVFLAVFISAMDNNEDQAKG
jgi:hypothetical protein